MTTTTETKRKVFEQWRRAREMYGKMKRRWLAVQARRAKR